MNEHEGTHEHEGDAQPLDDDLSVADLVDALFKANTKADGREFSHNEVAIALRERYGKPIDPSYLGKIRSGQIKNPGREALLMLCQFFKVPASYFFPELQTSTSDEDRTRTQLREALRAAGLSPQAQSYLEGLVDLLRQQGET